MTPVAPVSVPAEDYRSQLPRAYRRVPRVVFATGVYAGELAVLVGRVGEADVPAVAVYLPHRQLMVVTVPAHLAAVAAVPAERAS